LDARQEDLLLKKRVRALRILLGLRLYRNPMDIVSKHLEHSPNNSLHI